MSIFLPFILRILGAILDKYLQRQESRQAWIDFIEAASKEGLNSVKLAKFLTKCAVNPLASAGGYKARIGGQSPPSLVHFYSISQIFFDFF